MSEMAVGELTGVVAWPTCENEEVERATARQLSNKVQRMVRLPERDKNEKALYWLLAFIQTEKQSCYRKRN